MLTTSGCRPWLAIAVAVAAAAVASCKPSSEPGAPPPVLDVNTVVSGSLDGGQLSRSYTIHALAGTAVLVFAAVSSGAVEMSLEDVTHGIFKGPVTVTAGGDPVGVTPVLRVQELQSGALTLTVTGSPKGSAASYQLLYYRLTNAPEHVPGSFAIGDTVDQERLDTPEDLDFYDVHAPPGKEFVIVLDEVGGSGAMMGRIGSSEVYLTRAGVPLATDVVRAPDSGYTRFEVWPDGLEPSPNPSYLGAYRITSYLIDRAPETAPASVPFDSIIRESIDRPGDIDEFRFIPGADSEVAVFYQGTASSHLELAASSGQLLANVVPSRPDTAMFGATTGRIALSRGATYTARVVSHGHDLADTGVYRLFVHAVPPGPEHAPALLAPGDSVLQEAIDLPGDVDVFHVVIPESTWVNLAVGYSGPPLEGSALRADLLDSTTGRVVGSASAYGAGAYTEFGTGTLGQTGAVQLAPGRYLVRVEARAVSGVPMVQGPYKLWLYTFNLGPEHVSGTLAIGDSVASETLEPEADLDQFRFYATRGQHVDLKFQGLAGPLPYGTFVAFLRDPGGQPVAALYSAVSSPTRVVESGRLDLATGWYTVSVYGGSWPTPLLGETGPYRLALVPVGSAPETASPTVAVGDSVSTEALDNADDLDQFTLSAMPGRDVVVLFGTPAGCTGVPGLQLFDTATGAILADAAACRVVTEPMAVTPPAVVPASGQLAIAVSWWHASGFRECYGGAADVGATPYVFQVLPFSRLPETAPATYVLGDTVRTEAIDRPGDVDEFTLAATPGAALQPYFRLLGDPQPQGSVLTIEAVNSATGAVLLTGSYNGATTAFVTPGSFVVPASGTVLIRISGTRWAEHEIGTGPYAFYVGRAP